LRVALVLFASCAVVLAFPVSERIGAHPPSGVSCSYDFHSQTLRVTVDHVVEDPTSHYIESVELRRDGALVATSHYDSQPSKDQFEYVYRISAEPGDVLSATAHCSLSGAETGQASVTAPSDSVLPSISILTPAKSASISTIQATIVGGASDDVGLARVEVRLADGSWHLAAGTTVWSAQLALRPGNNTIVARATDGSGNEALTSVNVALNLSALPEVVQPIVSVSAPAGAEVQNSTYVTFWGNATDASGVALVELRVGGGSWVQANGTAPWSARLRLGEGANSVEVMATDRSGNAALASMTVDFRGDQPTWDPTLEEGVLPELWPYHALFMVTGVAFTSISIAFVALKKGWWQRAHVALGAWGAAHIIAGLSIGIYMVGETTGTHLAYPHSVLGVATIALTLIALAFGVLRFQCVKHVSLWRGAHIWLCRAMIVLLGANVVSGLVLAGVI
jgi:hypothetical protein